MKTIIKHTVQVIAFIIGLLILLLLVSLIFVPKGNRKDDGMVNESANGILAEKENSIEVLFLGDSECYSAFIPLQIWKDYGITSYNCGTPAQTLYQSAEYLKKTFEHHSPKIVILETNTIYNNFNRFDSFVYSAGQVFSVFNYHNRWKSLQPKDWSFDVNYTHIENGKGFYYSAAVSGASTDGYMEYTERIQKVSKQNIRYVEEINDFCKTHGAKLVLVSVPSTKNWNYERHNGIVRLSEKLDAEYLDINLINEAVHMDWALDTRDQGDHLNYSGAAKVTDYIGGYLSGQNLFKDMRAEPEYRDWNDYSDEFLNSIKKKEG